MAKYTGKYYQVQESPQRSVPCIVIPLSFLLIELFGLCFLLPEGESGLFPVSFGFLWSLALGGIVFLLPGMAARIGLLSAVFRNDVAVGFPLCIRRRRLC